MDADGNPLANPPVAANAFVTLRRGGFQQQDQTDALGRFASSEHLLLGSYSITIEAFEGGWPANPEP